MKRLPVPLLLALSAVTLPACQGPLQPVFPEVRPSVEWPKPPDQARVRYLGELTGEASLHAGRSGAELFNELLRGPRPRVGFSTPTAVAVDGDRVFVADGQAHAVYGLDLAARRFSTISQASGRDLEWPADLAFVEDELYVVDSIRAAVFVFDRNQTWRRTLGAGALKRPSAAAWNPTGRELVVLDAGDHAAVVMDLQGTIKSRVGRRGTEAGELNFPAGLAWGGPLGLIVADSMNFRVQRVAEDGRATTFGKKGDAAGDFALPRDVAVDSQGHIYVLDNQFENVQVFDGQGRLLMSFGEEGRGPGQFYLPSGITIDARDRIWIADTYNRRVQVFQYLGVREP